MALAELERDFKPDDVGAAPVLDKVLERYGGDDSPDYRRALEARIELAEVHDESERADELRALFAALDRRLSSRRTPVQGDHAFLSRLDAAPRSHHTHTDAHRAGRIRSDRATAHGDNGSEPATRRVPHADPLTGLRARSPTHAGVPRGSR